MNRFRPKKDPVRGWCKWNTRSVHPRVASRDPPALAYDHSHEKWLMYLPDPLAAIPIHGTRVNTMPAYFDQIHLMMTPRANADDAIVRNIIARTLTRLCPIAVLFGGVGNLTSEQHIIRSSSGRATAPGSASRGQSRVRPICAGPFCHLRISAKKLKPSGVNETPWQKNRTMHCSQRILTHG